MKELIKNKWLYIAGYLYLLSSIYIFFLGNLHFYLSIPICILMTVAFFKTIKNMPDIDNSIYKNKKLLILIVVIIIIWVLLAGTGGFIWQNTWDHKFRNALFNDLVNYKWPVVRGGVALCYYYGFWLAAAIVGKIFGLTAGYLAQTLWAIMGIVIGFLTMSQFLKKMKFSNLLILIFYSGLDVLFFYIFSKLSFQEATMQMLGGKHIELILNGFNSSSNTTLLFWLYNQIIPFWIGMSLILLQKNNKCLAFTYALLFLFAPFPMVALIPIIIYLVFKNYNTNSLKGFKEKYIDKIISAITLPNVISLFIIIPIGLFYMSNIAANKLNILDIDKDRIIRYIMYILFEFVIYIIFIYRSNRKDPILKILFITSLILPFIQLGNRFDFAYRTCIPLAFYIMLLVMKEINDKNTKKINKIFLIIILCIGAVTPMTEMIRTIRMEKEVLNNNIKPRSDALKSAFIKEGNQCYENFIATRDTIFYTYFTK